MNCVFRLNQCFALCSIVECAIADLQSLEIRENPFRGLELGIACEILHTDREIFQILEILELFQGVCDIGEYWFGGYVQRLDVDSLIREHHVRYI